MTRVIIAGAGIGGLVTALALHSVGIREVRLLERARTLRPLGSGINIMPQAVRELSKLELLDGLDQISIRTSASIYATHDGHRIWSEPRGHEAGLRWPQLSVHRGWLHRFLVETVSERFGSEILIPGAHVTAASTQTNTSDPVLVRYTERTSAEHRHLSGDLLVGADGIRSALRPIVAPHDPGPRRTGQVVWRGLTWGASFLDGRTMIIAGDGRYKVVFYPLAHEEGRTLVNWAASGPTVRDDLDTDWNTPADPVEVAAHFADWAIGGVSIADMIRRARDAFVYPIADLDPLESWSRGRVVLLGDAAHAMYPAGSNGATQSILDAASLAHHLASTGSIESAIADYERDRLPTTQAVQRANRVNGPEEVIDIVAQRRTGGRSEPESLFEEGEVEAIISRYARTSLLSETNTDSLYRLSTTTREGAVQG